MSVRRYGRTDGKPRPRQVLVVATALKQANLYKGTRRRIEEFLGPLKKQSQKKVDHFFNIIENELNGVDNNKLWWNNY